MDNTSLRIRRIISLMCERGHLAPDHATASASKLLEAEPLPPGFAFVAAALVRHAAILAPYDREKLRLAGEINGPIRHAPFTDWLTRALDLTQKEPVPENLYRPSLRLDSPPAFIKYLKLQPANIMRLPALLLLRETEDADTFQTGVQIISGSPSGMLAAPILAWNAHFLGEHFLAEMLLDEGILNFLTYNLRAVRALRAGDKTVAATHLINSLEEEPFQPAVITILAELEETDSNKSVARLEELHKKIAYKMSLQDFEAINAHIKDESPEDFIRTLKKALPNFRANAGVFWQTLALSLR